VFVPGDTDKAAPSAAGHLNTILPLPPADGPGKDCLSPPAPPPSPLVPAEFAAPPPEPPGDPLENCPPWPPPAPPPQNPTPLPVIFDVDPEPPFPPF